MISLITRLRRAAGGPDRRNLDLEYSTGRLNSTLPLAVSKLSLWQVNSKSESAFDRDSPPESPPARRGPARGLPLPLRLAA